MSKLLLSAIGSRYWIDSLNPWAIRFSNNVGIRWYGICYAVALLSVGYIANKWARLGRIPISTEDITKLNLYGAIGIFVGGHVMYYILYDTSSIVQSPFEILAVWKGGMSSHGCILGLTLSTCLFARLRKLNPWILLDAAAAIAPIGIVFGRIANFINGELWGRPTLVPWAVIFPKAPMVQGMQVPRHPSQLYAAVIEGVLVALVARTVLHRQRHPGLTTAVAALTYGLGRFADEFWREPDVGQPTIFGWMSKGQVFTLPVILVGFGLLLLYRKRSELFTEEQRMQ